jgi:D-sedoheptulose 7-phosphate isomerase
MGVARQVEALGRKGDVLIAISTSGGSPNVLKALEAARARGMKTVGLYGERRGAMEALCDVAVAAPSSDTQRIQEIHIVVGHAICEITESELFGSREGDARDA